ncbi:hypothetical protein Tco_0117198 [Tanacetum coccineum]
MADHSQKWYDETTSRNIGSSSSNNGLAALVNKLDNLGRDMKKLKESVHAIQVGCQIYEGPHLDKDCPLNEEVKQVEEEAIGENTKPILGKRKSHWCTSIHQQNYEIQEVWASCNPSNDECDGGSLRNNKILCYWEIDETMKKKILTEHWRKRFRVDYDDFNDFYDPNQCGDGRNNEIRERIIHNLHEEWFKGTSNDEDDIEGVKVTRYSLGPGEVYTKLEVSNIEELPRTRNNVATIRSDIMDEVFENYEDEMT